MGANTWMQEIMIRCDFRYCTIGWYGNQVTKWIAQRLFVTERRRFSPNQQAARPPGTPARLPNTSQRYFGLQHHQNGTMPPFLGRDLIPWLICVSSFNIAGELQRPVTVSSPFEDPIEVDSPCIRIVIGGCNADYHHDGYCCLAANHGKCWIGEGMVVIRR